MENVEQAVVNQEPKKAVVNTITVEEVKQLIKEAMGGIDLKLKEAIIPESLQESTEDDRQATDEEVKWIKENYDALFLRWAEGSARYLNAFSSKENDGYSMTISMVNYDEDGSINSLTYWDVYYNETSNNISVKYYEI